MAGYEVQGFEDLRLQISAAQPGYLAECPQRQLCRVVGCQWHVNDGISDGPYKGFFKGYKYLQLGSSALSASTLSTSQL